MILWSEQWINKQRPCSIAVNTAKQERHIRHMCPTAQRGEYGKGFTCMRLYLEQMNNTFNLPLLGFPLCVGIHSSICPSERP